MINARGELIERDPSTHESWLVLHGESMSGKAWLVGLSPERAAAVFVPKRLVEIGPSVGGFERLSPKLQRDLLPVCAVSGPGFLFDEKGLR